MPYDNKKYFLECDFISQFDDFLNDEDDFQNLDFEDKPILGMSKKKSVIDDEYIRNHTVKLITDLQRNIPELFLKKSSYNDTSSKYVNKVSNNQRKIVTEQKSERYKDITNLIELIPYNQIKDNFTIFDPKKGRFVPKETNITKKVFKENDLYMIQKYDDDIPMKQQVYRLIKILKPSDLVTNETLVMKLVSGPNNGIYSLTKLDCKMLNIPYESGLQLFSTELNWVNEETPKTNQTFYCDGEYIHIYFKLNDVYALNRKVVKIQDKYQCDLSHLLSYLDIRCFDNKRMFTDLILNDFTTEPLVRSEVIIHGLINVKDIKSMNEKIMLSVILDTNNF